MISHGGAVYYSGGIADSSFTSCSFVHNQAINGWGGAIYGSFTALYKLVLADSTFDSNKVISSYTNKGLGGAIFITSGFFLAIHNSHFKNNEATPLLHLSPSTYSGYGGALFIQNAVLIIDNSLFSGNKAITGQFDEGSNGGAIVLTDSNAQYIRNTTFLNNSALGYSSSKPFAQPGFGGAIYAKFASFNIERNCVFKYNWASSGGTGSGLGGAIAVFFGTKSVPKEDIMSTIGISISDTLFVNNFAFPQLCLGENSLHSGQGGAISFFGTSNPDVRLENVTFKQNFAVAGQQSYIVQGTLYAIGGAVAMSAKSNVSAYRCVFEENAVLFGVGNDLISYNGENNFECLDCEFYSIDHNNKTLFLHLVDSLQTKACSSFTHLTSGKSFQKESHHRFREMLLQSSQCGDSSTLNSFSKLVFDVKYYENRNISKREIVQSLIDDEDYFSDKAITVINNMINSYDDSLLEDKELIWLKKFNFYLTSMMNSHDEPVQEASTVTVVNNESKSLLHTTDISAPTNFNSKLFDQIITANPNFAAISGRVVLDNPKFLNGTYHVYFGSINSIYRSGLSDLTGYCDAVIYGDIINPFLIISAVNATLGLLTITKNFNGMIVGQIGLFRSKLFISNNITVNVESFIYNSSIESYVGHSKFENVFVLNSNYHFIRNKIRPVIIFDNNLFVGVNIANLFLYLKNGGSSNSKPMISKSYLIINYCNIVINHNLTFASFPFPVSSSSKDSFIDVILENGAFINITQRASMNLGINVNISGNSTYKYSVWNSG